MDYPQVVNSVLSILPVIGTPPEPEDTMTYVLFDGIKNNRTTVTFNIPPAYIGDNINPVAEKFVDDLHSWIKSYFGAHVVIEQMWCTVKTVTIKDFRK